MNKFIAQRAMFKPLVSTCDIFFYFSLSLFNFGEIVHPISPLETHQSYTLGTRFLTAAHIKTCLSFILYDVLNHDSYIQVRASQTDVCSSLHLRFKVKDAAEDADQRRWIQTQINTQLSVYPITFTVLLQCAFSLRRRRGWISLTSVFVLYCPSDAGLCAIHPRSQQLFTERRRRRRRGTGSHTGGEKQTEGPVRPHITPKL